MQVELFGDFGIGGIDFLLKFAGFNLKGFFGFAAALLAFVADCVWDGQDKSVVGSEIFVGE